MKNNSNIEKIITITILIGLMMFMSSCDGIPTLTEDGPANLVSVFAQTIFILFVFGIPTLIICALTRLFITKVLPVLTNVSWELIKYAFPVFIIFFLLFYYLAKHAN